MVQHTCKNCGNVFGGKYCNACGEKIYTEKDKSLKKLFEEIFHFIFHFEGSLFVTIKTIFSRPGQLSLDYCDGRRKKYFKPLSFFLLLVVIYLLFPAFEGLNQQLHYYTTNAVYGGFVRTKIQHAMHTTGLDFKGLETAFHQKSEKVSKFLLIILIPFTALFFWLLSFKKRRYFFDQMVFSAEVNSFFLFWGFLILPLLLTLFQRTCHAFTGSYLQLTDNMLSAISGIVVCSFVTAGSYRFYQFNKWYAVLFSVLFWFINFIIVQLIYKFVLFNIVINFIH
ncbi:hypothetical protein BH11BAC4_BH11BAC4_21710 [soil metagenome]